MIDLVSAKLPDNIKIKFIRNTRRKKLAIKVLPFEGIIIELPPYATKKDGERFLNLNIPWILKALQKVKTKENGYTLYNESDIVNTKFSKIIIKKTSTSSYGWHLKEGKGVIAIPSVADFSSMETQQTIRRILTEVYRTEAKMYLPGRTRLLADRFGFGYNNITVKNHKTKWGSCSGRNNINYNLNLMRLPDELIDYVILHELTHTVEKNHGPRFWNKLSTVCKDALILDKKLKKYSVAIY